MSTVRIKYCDGNDRDFAENCILLDAYLRQKTDGVISCGVQEKYSHCNQTDTIKHAVVIYADGIPIGSGALRGYEFGDMDDTAEIKRVFVREEYRRHGIGSLLMSELIETAKKQGYKAVILETGSVFEETIRFYAGLGFKTIPNYGPYKDIPESVCMRMELAER